MNDHQRLRELIGRMERLDGLSEDAYRRLMVELDRPQENFGYDDRGRLKIALMDARDYDIASFEAQNQGRYAIHAFQTRLDSKLAAAVRGFRVVCIFVNDTCDEEVVGILTKQGVQLIALRCAGFNNVDLDACRRHDLSVVRVPAYSPHAVADHTIALMLMLNRRLHLAYQRNRTGSFVLDGLSGFDMRGKTVGVVGTGKIGVQVIERLLGFGCLILAHDRFPNDELTGKPSVKYVELDHLLRDSDIVTLHVPLFPETHYLIDSQAIARMKPGVMLINTSRGGLVDTRALVAGLKSGKIGSAGLDVYEEEAGVFFRDMSGSVLTDDVLARLLTFNNVVITSHQAFLTREALANIAETTLANIAEFERGKRGAELTNAVQAP
jgi:D-lactate dehydrogenase